jgi:hypothetical protein
MSIVFTELRHINLAPRSSGFEEHRSYCELLYQLADTTNPCVLKYYWLLSNTYDLKLACYISKWDSEDWIRIRFVISQAEEKAFQIFLMK